MGQAFVYILYSCLVMIAGYLCYRWLLARERQAAFNRCVLLGIYAVSFVAYPLMHIRIGEAHAPVAGTIDLGALVPVSAQVVEEPLWPVVLVWIWVVGMALAAAWTVVVAVRLASIIRSGEIHDYDGVKLVVLDNKAVAPFSWGRYIVASRVDLAGAGGMIEVHELAHIRRGHWLDLLLAQAVCIVCWFNPAAWLLCEELKTVHEYQADDSVIASGVDARQYQMLLIKKAVGTRFQSLANSLNHSKLKQRITMMYSKRSGAGRRFRALALVPAITVALAVTNMPLVSGAMAKASQAELTVAKVNEKSGNAQAKSQVVVRNTAKTQAKKGDPVVVGRLDVSDVLPKFPGGEQELYKYMAMNIHYPQEAIDTNTQGRVLVGFTVETDGSLSDVKVLRGVSNALDAEAIRVVSAMPKWEPAKKDGKAVRVALSLPIGFKLSSDKSEKEAEVPERQMLDEAVVVSYGTIDKRVVLSEDRKPVIFIDGKKYEGKLNDLKPENIESITVRKDNPEYPDGVMEIVLKKN